MKKIIYIITLCLLQLSCEFRELTYDYMTCEAAINVDWSALEQKQGEAPSGMTVMFYPRQGGNVVITETNNINTAIVSLRAGRYDVLVFNQAVTDFGTIGFKSMDRFETAEVFAKSIDSKWYEPSNEDETVVRKPEYLAVATSLDFEVSDKMVEEAMNLRDQSVKSTPSVTIDFEPKIVVKNISIQMKIVGIQNIRAGGVRAAIKGMSVGYHFESQKSSSSMAVHLLEEWTITTDEVTGTKGEARAVFTSFGLPKQSTTTRNDDEWKGTLEFEILLVNNETVKRTASFGKHLVTLPDDEHSTEISIDVGISTTDPDDKPIKLPDVDPEDGGGFEGDLGGWEDEEDIDLRPLSID